jgi:hypothetical protein
VNPLQTMLVRLIALAAIAPLAGVAAASVPTPPDLPASFVVCPGGTSIPLRARVTYQASKFPIPLRLTPPDGSWSGGQWKTASAGCQAAAGRFAGYPPYYGWVAVGQGPGSRLPRGSILIMTTYGPTPSVVTAVNRLRTGLPRNEVNYRPTARTRLAGFYGYQFDGQVVAQHHFFLPFTPPGGAIGGGPDAVELEDGWVFRVIALNVRGKTVVIYIANVALPAGQFPAFLARANRILGTLAFPRGA